jgi:hypothetical protein
MVIKVIKLLHSKIHQIWVWDSKIYQIFVLVWNIPSGNPGSYPTMFCTYLYIAGKDFQLQSNLSCAVILCYLETKAKLVCSKMTRAYLPFLKLTFSLSWILFDFCFAVSFTTDSKENRKSKKVKTKSNAFCSDKPFLFELTLILTKK